MTFFQPAAAAPTLATRLALATALLGACGAALVVAAFEQRAGDAAVLSRELTELGAKVIGVVVNHAR